MVAFILSTSISIVFTGCEKSEMNQEFGIDLSAGIFEGEIDITPSSAKNGEEVTFQIKLINIPDIIENNPNAINVFYEIDGTRVAESSDVENHYSAKYKVDGLSVGEHKITAGYMTSVENPNFKFKMKSSILTITE